MTYFWAGRKRRRNRFSFQNFKQLPASVQAQTHNRFQEEVPPTAPQPGCWGWGTGCHGDG